VSARDRLVAEIDGVAWCIAHGSPWIEGEAECQVAYFNDDTSGDCVEVPLYLEADA